MSGRSGNAVSGASDVQASNWRVMSGGVVRAYSEYNEAGANTFFASETFRTTQYRLSVARPRPFRDRPMDGGSVVFRARRDLTLDGQLLSQAADGGRGGLVDIFATNIAVVGAGQDRSRPRRLSDHRLPRGSAASAQPACCSAAPVAIPSAALR